MKRITVLLAALLCGSGYVFAQKCDVSEFRESIHKVDSLFRIHTGAYARLVAGSVVVGNNGALDFHFKESLSDFPLRPGDEKWLRETLKENLPEKYAGREVGKIFINSLPVDYLVVPHPGNDGSAPHSKNRFADKRGKGIVERGIDAPLGLSGRHIALWQSHGRYYNIKSDSWKWQRACIFQIVEDLSTQSYVVPFLVPMLENAGANVFLPRERDFHREEVIVDNDPFETESGRIHGYVEMQGKWRHAGLGFADAFPDYRRLTNPFDLGSCLKCKCGPDGNSHFTWHAGVPERGEYAVYVSYATFSNSTRHAEYTIHAMGGDRKVVVNQRMGGKEWLYVGTYEFDRGNAPLVSLSNRTPDRGIVVADAVKIGGGMGNIARGNDSTGFKVSGMPRFAEGSRYFMQWCGVPHKVWSQNEEKDDYRDDFMSRGKWVQHLAGGSRFIPKEKGQNIPIDLSMAFHTDAGTRPDDSIVGTLAIYTRVCDGSTKFADGESRDRCREITDMMQTQVVEDIRALCDTAWMRRMLWNRSYSESRTTGVPGILLELLSHQNFEDMKYGLDPQFRFIVSRACYKAMLKFLSMRYGCPYAVQPLPVEKFSAKLDGNMVKLGWIPRADRLEPTARPESYIVYRRIDGGGWDEGTKVEGCSCSQLVEAGHIYSYKVVAVNKGGMSFPSEILSVGDPGKGKGKVLIINNFHRISGPTWFDQPEYAGFDNRSDAGVPYLYDWSFIGEQFEFRRNLDYVSDDNSGFGSSYEDYSDVVIAGNSFDYPYVHGLSIMKAGYAFDSCSSDALDGTVTPDCDVVDLICGKECRVKTASRTPVRGGIFPAGLISALKSLTAKGCDMIISGSYIGTDSFSSVYPINYSIKGGPEKPEAGSLESARRDNSGDAVLIDRTCERNFIRDSLGYSFCRAHGTRTGIVRYNNSTDRVSFYATPCKESYCAENCDALYPSGKNARKLMTYEDTGLCAATLKQYPGRSVAAFAFPLELVSSQQARDRIFETTLSELRLDK